MHGKRRSGLIFHRADVLNYGITAEVVRADDASERDVADDAAVFKP